MEAVTIIEHVLDPKKKSSQALRSSIYPSIFIDQNSVDLEIKSKRIAKIKTYLLEKFKHLYNRLLGVSVKV